uniref:Macrophage mannose receptor 1 n=1 Tax=Denticeps clupeoides TaxID=299321 RepID=A0AAY4A3Z7_9TELE
MRGVTGAAALLFVHVLRCSAQAGVYPRAVTLTRVRPSGVSVFSWTSAGRIFSALNKKCLGAGSMSDGSGLQFYFCDDAKPLQKWECANDTLIRLKDQNLFLSQGDDMVLKLTSDQSAASHWLIHGTEDGVCSRPYEDLFTIEGNAFGRPCHFPFKFNSKWYAECLNDQNKGLWCSPDVEYQGRWGKCPTTSTDGWKKNPVTGIYYQVNANSALKWHQARKSCQQQGADLVSITEPHEQTFISGIQTSTTLWTGLNRLNDERGWQWVNGAPFRYLKWGSGQPVFNTGSSCVAMSGQENYNWKNVACSRKFGYICQKGSTVPTATAEPGNAPWIPYLGHCYVLNRTKFPWQEAQTECVKAGGNLASVHNVEEQSFILTQLGYAQTDELWIGLNDKKTQLLFDWIDHSSVTYTTWAAEEPSHKHFQQEDCVLIKGTDGKWADEECENKYGFICKKPGSSKPDTGPEVRSEGCKAGWIRYGYNCYYVGSEAKTFDEAKTTCEQSGSYLVDVPHRLENAFLVSLVGMRAEKYFWIGLSNQKEHHLFVWTKSTRVDYTHWNARMPGRKQGCVAMTTGAFAGLWDVLSCSNKEKYICKHRADGVVTTPAPPTTPAYRCADGWHEMPNRPFCFKHYEMNKKEKRTWFEALDFCRALGGDLAFMTTLIPRYDSAWIGLSNQDPNIGFVWSDGSSSSFENWNDGEPNNANNVENCVELISTYYSHGKWNDLHCEIKKDFICQIHKGKTPSSPSNATLPTYNETSDGWIEFHGHQYYFSYFMELTMDDARQYCRSKHANLVIINSEKERVFLWQRIIDHHDDYFIGMTIDLDEFKWVDGSPVIFPSWDANEPDFKTNNENCVVMGASMGFWRVRACGRKTSFICERNESPPANATVSPTIAPVGGCASDWSRYRQYCYKIGFGLKDWSEARASCKSDGGNLVSIRSSQEQAFLTTMIKDAPGDLWIGLTSADSGWEYYWTDGKGVSYTNFKRANRWSGGWRHAFYDDRHHHFLFRDEANCVVMKNEKNKRTGNTGKWEYRPCSDAFGFICKRGIDHQITPKSTELPKSYVKLGNDSLKLETRNLSWADARKNCEADGANLASIRDSITQAYIELQVNKLTQPVWIGLNRNQTNGIFKWIDKWPLSLVQWAPGEPAQSHPCVYMDGRGLWHTTPCNNAFPSVCKQSTDVPPPTPTQHPGTCPDETWVPFRHHCYLFEQNGKSWSMASTECNTRSASLLSIQDTQESDFIKEAIQMFEDTETSFWISLYKNHREQWNWLDGSVLDYTNWGPGEPVFSSYGHIFTSNGMWGTSREYSRKPFICKTRKGTFTYFTDKPLVASGGRFYIGMVMAVLITLLAVAGVAAALFYQKGFHLKPQLPFKFENPLYFTSSNPTVSDVKNLVANMEVEPGIM